MTPGVRRRDPQQLALGPVRQERRGWSWRGAGTRHAYRPGRLEYGLAREVGALGAENHLVCLNGEASVPAGRD